MGNVVQLLERSTKPARAPTDAIQLDAVKMPLRTTRDQIVTAASMCEILSQSVAVLQGSRKTLDAMVGMIDDPEAREKPPRA
jgi:hypothetical protein